MRSLGTQLLNALPVAALCWTAAGLDGVKLFGASLLAEREGFRRGFILLAFAAMRVGHLRQAGKLFIAALEDAMHTSYGLCKGLTFGIQLFSKSKVATQGLQYMLPWSCSLRVAYLDALLTFNSTQNVRNKSVFSPVSSTNNVACPSCC